MSLKDVVESVITTGETDPVSARSAMIDKLRQARTAFAMKQSEQAGGHWLATVTKGVWRSRQRVRTDSRW
jgi:hypothetical protein